MREDPNRSAAPHRPASGPLPSRVGRWGLLPGMLAILAAPECNERLVDGRPPREGVFTLRVGEHVAFEPLRAEIGFRRVTGDSRCPTGVLCVWEGQATVRLWVLQPPSPDTATVDLTLPGARPSPPAPLGSSHEITARRLDPYPAASEPIPQADYVVTLEIARRR